jgi:hypothetical protein
MWSIGIYVGDTPFNLRATTRTNNPVLTLESVSNVDAKFVADPFMVANDAGWYMFFEVLNTQRGQGEIGLATSDNGFDWTYRQIVLTEPFHLSYPYVFEWRDDYYMVPETLPAGAVCLYKAEEFPTRWSLAGRLIEGAFADPSIFRFENRWWMFACSTPYEHDTLRLFFAEDLLGPWQEHAGSPIVNGNKCQARPAGRILQLGEKIIRFAQDCVPDYGSQVRAFEISTLTESSYVEREIRNSPILTASGSGWNAGGMHHVDAHLMANNQWIACVDGYSQRRNGDAGS